MKAIKYKKGVYYRSIVPIGGDLLDRPSVFRFQRAVDAVGGDITSSLISKIPYELHLRDTSFKKYSYCGH